MCPSRKLALFCTNTHHGGAEGLEKENGGKDVLVWEPGHHLCDLGVSGAAFRFSGHNSPSGSRLTLQYSVVCLSYIRPRSSSTKIRTVRRVFPAAIDADKPLSYMPLHGFDSVIPAQAGIQFLLSLAKHAKTAENGGRMTEGRGRQALQSWWSLREIKIIRRSNRFMPASSGRPLAYHLSLIPSHFARFPFAFPPPCPYNTAMESKAPALCETEKKRWLMSYGQQSVVSRSVTCRPRKRTGIVSFEGSRPCWISTRRTGCTSVRMLLFSVGLG